MAGSANGGSSWTDISSNLPRVPIRAIARHPDTASTLYVGTEIGVWVTEDTGNSWKPIMDGPANVSVDELTFMNDSSILLAATHGRGLWTCDVDALTSSNVAPADFDGDGRTDFSVFRPSPTPTWHLWRSLAGYTGTEFGSNGDVPLAPDFDGDNKADITVFRPSNGTWYWIKSSNSTTDYVQFGTDGDVPMPGDFDGDGYSDQAVFRPGETTMWYFNCSDDCDSSLQWGIAADLPVVADFDDEGGDGKSDIGVFRLENGFWHLYETTNGYQYTEWGLEGDVPVPGDYDGDGTAEVAVWRPDNGTWYLDQSTNGFAFYAFGEEEDLPVPGDYDGDGRMDAAVWRPGTSSVWLLRQSSNGFRAFNFGASTDIPIPSYVLDRPTSRPAPLRRSLNSPPRSTKASAGWRAPGIPAGSSKRAYKPGTVPGLSDLETVKKVLGGRATKKADRHR